MSQGVRVRHSVLVERTVLCRHSDLVERSVLCMSPLDWTFERKQYKTQKTRTTLLREQDAVMLNQVCYLSREGSRQLYRSDVFERRLCACAR